MSDEIQYGTVPSYLEVVRELSDRNRAHYIDHVITRSAISTTTYRVEGDTVNEVFAGVSLEVLLSELRRRCIQEPLSESA